MAAASAFAASMAAATKTTTHYCLFCNRKTPFASATHWPQPYTTPRLGLGLSDDLLLWIRRTTTRTRPATTTVCFVVSPEKDGETRKDQLLEAAETLSALETQISVPRVEERMMRKKKERRTYLVAAVLASFGFTSVAIAAVYYRFAWQMEGGEVPVSEMVGTFALSIGAAVGMEFWARWAHRALWHASLWHMHESHHKPREGPFELNDVFAIINSVPAIGLMAFGFFHSGLVPGLVPGLCFGAGLGITLFGMAYMFVHDGMVHRRFPVGPIANVPYFRRVAAAHQIHHSEKFKGVPYGLFLGPMELEEVGGTEELEKEVGRRIKGSSGTAST